VLAPAERKALKAKAHRLDPVVQIGDNGLTEQVIAEIERALRAHELIKVRAGSLDRPSREQVFQSICDKTQAEAVQHIGKVLVLYRRRTD
jgi:RNA-binding protein